VSAPSAPRIRALDGLRGLAILLVFVTHAVALPLHPASRLDQAVRTWAHAGWTGADLFFVISGFLITGILLDARGRPRWLRNFFVRRALRIFPLYFGALAVVIGLATILHATSAPLVLLRANQAWYWTYTVNILGALTHGQGTPPYGGHAWSLSIEEQFYLLWPFVVWRVPRRRLLTVVVGVMLAGLAFRTWLVWHDPVGNANAAFLATPGRLDGLMVGSALAVLSRGAGGLASIEAAARPVLASAVFLLLWLGIVRHGFENAPRDPVMAIASYPLVALGWGALLVLALRAPNGRLARALGAPALARWGKYSYGVYLLHLPLVGLLMSYLPLYGQQAPLLAGSRTPIIVVLAAGLAFVSYWLAALSYHAYERRFLALKRNFTTGR
jgi:peptidoglycan/LPS O-acetylase OafA/YrhL